jgi:hypothetical protein
MLGKHLNKLTTRKIWGNNMRNSMRCACAMAGFVMVTLFGGLAAVQADSPPPPAQPLTPKVGDTFVYASNFMTVACSSWQITSLNENGFIVSKCGGNTAYNLVSNGDFVKIVDSTGKVLVQFKPYFSGMNFPLTLGKSWEAKYSGYTDDDGNSWNSDQTCNVAAYETVQVAAGSFSAYKVVCEDHWSSGPFTGTTAMKIWYAPQANTIVKVRSPDSPKWNMELSSETLH